MAAVSGRETDRWATDSMASPFRASQLLGRWFFAFAQAFVKIRLYPAHTLMTFIDINKF